MYVMELRLTEGKWLTLSPKDFTGTKYIEPYGPMAVVVWPILYELLIMI